MQQVEPMSPLFLVKRVVAPEDMPFLLELYTSTRWEELEPTEWTDEAKHKFLASQFEAQHVYYQEHYKDTSFDLLLYRGARAGRLYLQKRIREYRIVDISLLPAFRGGGLGTFLIEEIQKKARAEGAIVSIHVEQNNPAMSLYLRLGFEKVEEVGPYFLMKTNPRPTA